MDRMDPVVHMLYWYFLKRETEMLMERSVLLAFMFEGATDRRAMSFVKKYANKNSELYIVAKHCYKNKRGKYDIDWEAVEEEMEQKGIGDYGIS